MLYIHAHTCSMCSSKNQLDGGSLGWGVRFEFCVGCVAVSVSCSTLPKLIQALFQNDINLVLKFVLGVNIEPRDSPPRPRCTKRSSGEPRGDLGGLKWSKLVQERHKGSPRCSQGRRKRDPRCPCAPRMEAKRLPRTLKMV